MTPEQKARLFELLGKMRANARACPPGSEESRRWMEVDGLDAHLKLGDGFRDYQEWLEIAQRDAAGHDKSRAIRMTMAEILSGLPPEALRRGQL